jgi:hypothetical protein
MRTVVILFLLLATGCAWAANPLLEACLKPGRNKQVCTAYLTQIMGSVRFGTVTPQKLREPFCLDRDEMTDAQYNMMFQRFAADNPDLERSMQYALFGVLTVKGRCED